MWHFPACDECKRQTTETRFGFAFGKTFGEINDKTYRAALFVEMVHTATLIHDDVIDESGLRRGKPSVNAHWGNRTAVLSGDYILSKAVLNLSENGDYDILSEVLRTACLMSEGELMQSDKAAHFDINEADYFNIITRKTATLMEVCCKTGAFSVDAGRQQIGVLAQFGKYLGIAFQIRDDIFDFQPSPELGKPAGNDIREHNFTLPLIFASIIPMKPSASNCSPTFVKLMKMQVCYLPSWSA